MPIRSAMRSLPGVVVGCLVLATGRLAAQSESIDRDALAKIRDAGLTRSQIDSLAGYLTDVIGPRLTGSDNMRRAQAWAVETLRGWGLDSARVEPWGMQGPGWENEYAFARMLTPYSQTLHVAAVAGSAGTNGRVRGPVVVVDDPIRSTLAPAEYAAGIAGKLRGAWVMSWQWRPVAVDETDPPFYRYGEDPSKPPASRPAAGGAPATPLGPPPDWKVVPLRLRALDSLMRAERSLGYLGVWTPRPYGLLSGYGVSRTDATGRLLEWIVDPSDSLVRLDMTYEQYGQIWRNARRNVPVSIEVEVRNRILPENTQRSNVFAELKGTDKADEYVVIGAHLDSWHVGTGATDNGAGVVVTMEAMRILRASGLQARRTIRIGLWDPEERSPWGSQRWLAAHPELHPRISAYLNVDNGSGRLRGIRLGSSAQAAAILTALLRPLRDLGMAGVLTENQLGQSDHEAFEGVGIPAFDFAQDPLDYWQRTHHTSADTYERLDIEDLKQAAVVVASTAYLIANRGALMPRAMPRNRPR